MVFGPEIGGYLTKPVDAMVTTMSLGEYAERVDMLMIAIWQPAVTLRMARSLYAAAVGVGRVLGLKERRPAVYPLAVSVLLLAIWAWPSAESRRPGTCRPPGAERQRIRADSAAGALEMV